MRKIVAQMLKGLGAVEVCEAADGSEAVKRLQERTFDLLLTDWEMPVMDGLALVRAVRGDQLNQEVPVILMTMRNRREDIQKASKIGVDRYLIKPFSAAQLEDKIQSVLATRSRRQVEDIVLNEDPLSRQDDHPLIIFGERQVVIDRLADTDKRDVLRFFTYALKALKALNRRNPDRRIGYAISRGTADVTRHVRFLRDRIKLLVLPVDMPGGGVTLARLARVNSQSAMNVLLVCQDPHEIPANQRTNLDKLGILVCTRGQLDVEGFDALFTEHALSKVEAPALDPASPVEEVRRRLENDIRNMVELPVLPDVYQRITALDQDPESTTRQWADAILMDPLAQAQVIRRARSPLYGFRGEISDVQRAVVLLGRDTVKQVVVAGALKRAIEEVGSADEFDVETYWLHSVAVANVARLLHFRLDQTAWTQEDKKTFEGFGLEPAALDLLQEYRFDRHFAQEGRTDPFVAGMMHDIGKAAMAHAYPGLLPLVFEEMKKKAWSRPMLAAERAVSGGTDHCQLGAILARSWKLGQSVEEPVENHHAPSRANEMSMLVALADCIAGAFYPYPKPARYPLGKLLAAPVDGSKDIATQELEASLSHFLPEDIEQKLSLDAARVLALAGALEPAIRRLTEAFRQGI